MKTFAIVLAALVAAALPATALAATAAPAAVGAAGSCDNVLKTPAECAVWTVKCIGDALGGNACHDDAAATEGPKEFVACTVGQVEQVLEGVTPMPCAFGAAAAGAVAPPDVEQVVECTKGQVRQILAGVTPMPCPIG